MQRMYPNLVRPLGSQLRCFFVPKSTNVCGKRGLACVYIRAQRTRSAETTGRNKTVLISHTNAEDLGLMIGKNMGLSNRLAVDVLAYDYSGYGRSGGPCSENSLYEDIERVYEFMVDKLKIPPIQVKFDFSLFLPLSLH